jgi:hypothetical protein
MGVFLNLLENFLNDLADSVTRKIQQLSLAISIIFPNDGW